MADKKVKVDIFAVAKLARTSTSTVSRSFNHPELVNPAARKRIDRAVRKLGYIRNRAAQTIHGRRSGTIGLVVPTIDNAIFAEVIQAFSTSVEAQGFSLLVASHGYNLEREYASVRKFLEHRVDGIALIGLEHSEETYRLIEGHGTPATTIWNYDPASRLSCVGVPNHLAGARAAECLLAHGHREIGLLFPPLTGNDRAKERYLGARDVLEAAGVEVRETRVLESVYSLQDAKQTVAEMFAAGDVPSALLCGNDVLAAGALYAAQSLGRLVPQDLSIIGIGDFKGSGAMSPGLTTVRLPARRIGTLAGAQIAQAITSGACDIERTGCEIELVLRETVAPLDASR